MSNQTNGELSDLYNEWWRSLELEDKKEIFDGQKHQFRRDYNDRTMEFFKIELQKKGFCGN